MQTGLRQQQQRELRMRQSVEYRIKGLTWHNNKQAARPIITTQPLRVTHISRTHAKVALTTEGSASSRFFIIYPLAFLYVASGGLRATAARVRRSVRWALGLCQQATRRDAIYPAIRPVSQSVCVTLSTRASALLSPLVASIARGSSALPEVELSKIKYKAQVPRGTVVKLNILFWLVHTCRV